ncbi:hypothetical protein [Gulosibacter sediminis]|uniref:hypothetical protein n=1 Tax=Gulosibacter sediminis TaxID=1729695 RepID=UPI0024A7AAB7|nr:hypothetical protein [Gulosibacter sediminis]
MAGYTIEYGAQWKEPTTKARRKAIQTSLKVRGLYSGPADGAWGPNTIRGIQLAVRDFYSGPADGAVGQNTCWGVLKLAYRQSGYHSSLLLGNGYLPASGLQIDPNLYWDQVQKAVTKGNM